MRTYTLSIAAAVSASMLSPAAEAAVKTYQFNGVFEDGRTVSGKFGSNPEAFGGRIDQYSNVNVFLSGVGQANVLHGTGSVNSASALFFSDNDRSFEIQLAFMAPFFPTFSGLTSNDLYGNGTFYWISGGIRPYQLTSGTIFEVASVPEPSGWASMLIGAACAAFALRRYRLKAPRVTFAAQSKFVDNRYV